MSKTLIHKCAYGNEGYLVGSVDDGGTVYKETSEALWPVGSVSDGGTVYTEGLCPVGSVDASGAIYKGTHQVGYVDASGNVHRGSHSSELSRRVGYAYGASKLAYLGGAALLLGLLEDEPPPLRCPRCGSPIPEWLQYPGDYLRCDHCAHVFPRW